MTGQIRIVSASEVAERDRRVARFIDGVVDDHGRRMQARKAIGLFLASSASVGSTRARGLWFGNIRRKVGIASVAGTVSTPQDGSWPSVAGKGSTSRRSTVVKCEAIPCFATMNSWGPTVR